MKDAIVDSNFPFTEDRRTYHVALKHGEVANRILTVGTSIHMALDSSQVTIHCELINDDTIPSHEKNDRFSLSR